MKIEELKVLLEKKYVNFREVNSYKELSKNQDSYLLKDNFIIGINLKNVDIKDIINQIFEIESLNYLYFHR